MKTSLLVSIGLSASLFACASSTTGSSTSGSSGAAADRPKAIAALKGDSAKGKTVYETNCKGCHGLDGAGNMAAKFPSLAEPGKNDTAEQLAGYVVNGVPDAMPSMPSFAKLSDQDIADTVAYVKTTFGK
jgi:cytochrome c oxidase subunit II